MPSPTPNRRAFQRQLLSLLGAPALSALPAPAALAQTRRAEAETLYAHRPDAMQWADALAARLGLPADWVRGVIGQARRLPRVQRLIVPPTRKGARHWRQYRSRFIDPVRIAAGVRFWQRNASALARAQAEYGVPPQIIAGIIGVETLYGQNMGNFRVIDALATLTFDFPPQHPRAQARQSYFEGELGHFIDLCQRNGMHPLDPLGSYAGAMGMPQFMPSSWLNHATDFDGDGRIDLWDSEADAIGSVARYFRNHGWQPGQPTHYPVRLREDADLPALLATDIKPALTPARFAELGALPLNGGTAHPGPLALIELPNGDPDLPGNTPDYVAGTDNFYVVTRYNQSSFYALSVIELGQAIAARLHGAEREDDAPGSES